MDMIKFSDLYGIHPNHEKPAKGKILVASPLLKDECFNRAVIYMLDDEKDNIFAGVVLNKKSEYFLGDIIQDRWIPRIPVFCGGPVATGRLLYIHCLGNLLTGSVRISSNIYLGMDLLSVVSYISAGNKVDGYIKFFLGYSGWSPGQLNMEIATESWGVGTLAYTEKCLEDDDALWRKSVISLGDGYSPWLHIPGSLSDN